MSTRQLSVALLVALSAAGCSEAPKPETGRIVMDVTGFETNKIANPEGTIRHVWGGPDNKVLLELHTPYPGGDQGHVFYRQDGTLNQAREEYGNGQQKSEASWSLDGKTLLHGVVYRPDGTRKLVRKALYQGKSRTDYYLPDGKWLFMSRDISADGKVWTEKFFHRDGTIWSIFRKELVNNSLVTRWQETYTDITHVVSRRVDYVKGGKYINFHSADGRLSYRQYWREGSWESFAGNNLHLAQLDEFTTWGSTSRTLLFEDEKLAVTVLEARESVTGGVETRKYRVEDASETVIESRVFPQFRSAPRTVTRNLRTGTLAEIFGPNGRHEKVDAEKNIRERIDVARLIHPAQNELDAAISQFNSENVSFLGARNDADPSRWYHKP